MAFKARLLPLVFGIGGLLGTGCGDASDPAAITNLELKSPTGLTIIDQGEGKVTLQWYTSNPEDDFEGYNIYGGQVDSLPSGVTEGSPIKLLDTNGEESASAKSALADFAYDAANTDKALPGAPAAAAADEEANALSRLPIHKVADGEAVLPTCQPANGVCTAVSSSISDASAVTSNGLVTYDLFGQSAIQLTEGKQYCFFVLSSQSEGTEVSEASSNVACVTPRYKHTISWTNADSASQQIDLVALLADCVKAADHTCGTTTILASRESSSKSLRFLKNKEFETPGYQDQDARANIYVKRMGYYPDGFAGFSEKAPQLAVDPNDIEHGGGYSIEGQSVLMEDNGMFAIAVGDAARANTTKFYYHYLWIDGSSAGTSVKFELRLAKNQDQF